MQKNHCAYFSCLNMPLHTVPSHLRVTALIKFSVPGCGSYLRAAFIPGQLLFLFGCPLKYFLYYCHCELKQRSQKNSTNSVKIFMTCDSFGYYCIYPSSRHYHLCSHQYRRTRLICSCSAVLIQGRLSDATIRYLIKNASDAGANQK